MTRRDEYAIQLPESAVLEEVGAPTRVNVELGTGKPCLISDEQRGIRATRKRSLNSSLLQTWPFHALTPGSCVPRHSQVEAWGPHGMLRMLVRDFISPYRTLHLPGDLINHLQDANGTEDS